MRGSGDGLSIEDYYNGLRDFMKDEEIRKQAKKVAARFGKTYDQRQDIEGRCLEVAWEAEKRIEEERNPRAYLCKAMQNVAINYVLKEKRNRATTSCQIPDTISFNPEDDLVTNIVTQDNVAKFMQKLESPDREIISLMLKGHSLNDIAKELGLRANSIAVRIHRNKKEWQRLLDV